MGQKTGNPVEDRYPCRYPCRKQVPLYLAHVLEGLAGRAEGDASPRALQGRVSSSLP
jgi:hypothetical protein